MANSTANDASGCWSRLLESEGGGGRRTVLGRKVISNQSRSARHRLRKVDLTDLVKSARRIVTGYLGNVSGSRFEFTVHGLRVFRPAMES